LTIFAKFEKTLDDRADSIALVLCPLELLDFFYEVRLHMDLDNLCFCFHGRFLREKRMVRDETASLYPNLVQELWILFLTLNDFGAESYIYLGWIPHTLSH